jgi:MFS family permease
VFFFLDVPKPQVDPHASTVKRSIGEVLREKPVLIVAMICALVSFALMNLVMTSTPLAVVGCGFTKNDAANVVSAHVLAMYIPSFFTGHVIRRIGAVAVIALGLVILLCAGIVALMGVELENFYISLILLGVGWNFGFIGSTTLLAKNHSAQEQGLVQGVNDFVVFGGVTLASLASGGLMNCSGGAPQDGWSMVNLAMVPFLMLAAAALLYLARLRLKDARA